MEIFRSRSRPKQKLNNCFDANINNAMHMQNQHTITLTPAPFEIKPACSIYLCCKYYQIYFLIYFFWFEPRGGPK
ncbi:hypothetical protein CUMW_079370 [Citrus unshiu]|uniref:Uncharacterized protein n=1 Tax=Citrus unshiu TaxID=55188 RepID=A0A2H5NVB7_CITUN|nr:hypothetical protein CUMW_079370 [Citrus unshiu]